MSTMEKLFVQIFERKKRIVEQLRLQKQLYDHHLASKLLIQGITPPPWLLNSAEYPTSFSSSFTSDPKDVSKEDVISGLLLRRPPPEPSYPIAPTFHSKSVVTDGVIDPPDDTFTTASVGRKDSDGTRAPVLPQRLFEGPELTQSHIPESPLDKMVAEDCPDVSQSLVRIHRSKSRQKALEFRNSGKAASQNLSQGKPASGATSHEQSVKGSGLHLGGRAVDEVASHSQRRNLSFSLEESLLDKPDIFDKDRIHEFSAEEPVAQLGRSSTHDEYGNLIAAKEGSDHMNQSLHNQEEEVDVCNGELPLDDQCSNVDMPMQVSLLEKKCVLNGEGSVSRLSMHLAETSVEGKSLSYLDGNLIAAKQGSDHRKQSVYDQEEEVYVCNDVLPLDGQCSNVDMPTHVSLLEQRCVLNGDDLVSRLSMDLTETSVEGQSVFDLDGNLIAAEEGSDHRKQCVHNQEDNVHVCNDVFPLDGQCCNVDMPMRVTLLEQKCVSNGEDSISVEQQSLCDLNGNIISSVEEYSYAKQNVSSKEDETSKRLTVEPDSIKVRSSNIDIGNLKLPQENNLTEDLCIPWKEDEVSNLVTVEPNASIARLSLREQHGDSELLMDDSLLVNHCVRGKEDEALGGSVLGSDGFVDMVASNTHHKKRSLLHENPSMDSHLSPEEKISRKESGGQLFVSPSDGFDEKLEVHYVSNISKETSRACAKSPKCLSEGVNKTDALHCKRDFSWPQNKRRKLAFKTSNNESLTDLNPAGGSTVDIPSVLSNRLSLAPTIASNIIFLKTIQSRHSSLCIEPGNASVAPPEQDTEEAVAKPQSSIMEKKLDGSRNSNLMDSNAADRSSDNGPYNLTCSQPTSCKQIFLEEEKRSGVALDVHPSDGDTDDDMKTLTCSEKIRNKTNSVGKGIESGRVCVAFPMEHGDASPMDHSEASPMEHGEASPMEHGEASPSAQRSLEGKKSSGDMPSYTPVEHCTTGIVHSPAGHIDGQQADNFTKNLTYQENSIGPSYNPMEYSNMGIENSSAGHIDAPPTDDDMKNLTYLKSSDGEGTDSDRVFAVSSMEHGKASPSHGGPYNMTISRTTHCKRNSLREVKRSSAMSNSTPMEHYDIRNGKRSNNDIDANSMGATANFVKNITSENIRYQQFSVEPRIGSGIIFAASSMEHGKRSRSHGSSDNLTLSHTTDFDCKLSSLEGKKRSGDMSSSTPMEHCNIGIERRSANDLDTISTDRATDDYMNNLPSEKTCYEKFSVELEIDSGEVNAASPLPYKRVSGIGSEISVLERFTFVSENSGTREDFHCIDLPNGVIERASYLEQLCESASLDIPLSHFNSTRMSCQTPNMCRSVPIGLLEHFDSRSAMEFNSDDAGVNGSPGETCQNSYLQGKSYSDTNFPSHWDIKRPYSPPFGKASDGTTNKSGGSNKRVSSNPELTCFPIEESTEENMNDSVNEASTCIETTGSVSVPWRESLESMSTEISLTEIKNKTSLKKKQHFHRNVHGKLGKENQSASLSVNDVKTHSESHSTSFSKSKVSGKPSMKSRYLRFSEKEPKHNNIVSNLKSFVPLVQQKQAAAAPPAKKEVRVKALEAAEAAKRLAEQKEIDRKKMQEARKLERVKKLREKELQNDLARKAKEQEKNKKEAEKAARKRQREEDERREKDKKRKRLEEAQNLHREQDKRLAEMRKEPKLKAEVEKSRVKDDLNEGRKNPVADLYNISDSSIIKVKETETGGCSTPKCEHSNSVAEMTREQSYEISPYVCSDDDEDDEEDDKPNNKFVPDWSRRSRLVLALSSQQSLNSEEIFIPGNFCSLEEVLLPRRLCQ